ncbi:type VI secretion system Vgr family protein [Tritonibacter multivorans]|uniref:Type VI secretion system Vgr family protein n=1 Tax=Tritonibacter multivorans TaxID=928856 RepID=A0A0P1GA35_9RHOB|nr:type VI secretion system tip protein TssI/VgrG [Tritonibacter multivorans]MDA7422162.1 type VI secretion system tip protein TssI/VgrG [Tritonibacter multivorans]CUH78343.1 type VI secretion system Vgr family protein [Tritonibacter multivorans]SFD15521.1 type VI secretion system secreted protein VgrG [Tritonibacter multivorans]
MSDAAADLIKLSVDGSLELEVIDFSLREGLSEVPVYNLTVLDQTQTLDALVGQPCTLAFPEDLFEVAPRDFAGLVMAAERVLDATGSPMLRLKVQPVLAVLGLSVHSAMYQNKDAVDIVKEVLARNGLSRLKISGSKGKAKRETVIQYNENDLEFCRRILAEEGLAFYFHDGSAADTLVIHDVQNPFPKGAGGIELTDAEMSDVERMEASQLSLRRALRPDKVELTHYDAEKADMATAGPAVSSAAKTTETPSVVEYRHVTIGDLKTNELKVLAAAEQAPELGLSGTCEHPGMFIGQELDIASANQPDLAGRYVVIGLTYTPKRGNAVSCQFEAVSADNLPAPERLPKPLIAGVHNAIVVGGSSAKAGEVACDAEGRVQVRFFWDKTSSASGYLRVAEPYAGNGYGSQFLPRVGHEVLVSFLHGDPDAPVITGQIYTDKHKPPFAEKNSTKSGIRTKLEGDPNELEFDDKKGAELIGLRAAKDFELLVTENVTRDVKKLDTTKIGETSKLDIGKNWEIAVTEAQTNSAKSRTSTITEGETVEAKEITLEGSSKITLKVGSSKIELSSSGIKIDAPKVEISGSSKVDVKSDATLSLSGLSSKLEAKTTLDLKGLNIAAKGSAMVKVEGPMAEVSASGVLTLKGSMAMIN